MAASSKIGGYQCEFVGTVSEDFVCGLCKHVAREPRLTECCGMTVCRVCISPVIEDKKSCPSCEKAVVVTFLNVRDNQRILTLEVRCIMKDRGCEWTDKLEGLEAHLDVNAGDCEYVDVECPNRCDQPIQKRSQATHLANSCPKREYACQYCNFKATYAIIYNDHWPQCSFYPVPCLHGCGIQAIERGDVEAHLLQCPLEEVECKFWHAGCNTKLPRRDLEKHMEENTQKHLALMSETNLRMRREFENKLQQQQDEIQRYAEGKIRETTEKFVCIQQMQTTLDEKQQQINALAQNSQQSLQMTSQEFDRKLNDEVRRASEEAEQLQVKTQESETKIQDLQFQLQQKTQQVDLLQNHMSTALICPSISTNIVFEMPNFSQHRDQKDYWHGPPLYTHPCGYKFNITVWTGACQGSHVAVYLDAMKGEFDSQLQWPAKWTVTLQLLNQERDQDHVTVTELFSWDKPTQERCGVKCFREEFISYKDLENIYCGNTPAAKLWYAHQSLIHKKTQYLKDNRLLFKVVKVERNRY